MIIYQSILSLILELQFIRLLTYVRFLGLSRIAITFFLSYCILKNSASTFKTASAHNIYLDQPIYIEYFSPQHYMFYIEHE